MPCLAHSTDFHDVSHLLPSRQSIFDFIFQHDERKSVFADNLARIESHNAEHAAGKKSFWLGVNQFADLTNEEFVEQYTGYMHLEGMDVADLSEVQPAATIDWRDQV